MPRTSAKYEFGTNVGVANTLHRTAAAGKAWFRRSRRNAALGIGLVVGLGTAIPWLVTSWRARPEVEQPLERPSVLAARVDPTSGARAVRFSGRLAPLRSSRLAFVVAGRVAERAVELGERVEAGAALLSLEREDLEHLTELARASLQRTQARVSYGARVHTRMRSLAEADASPLSALEDAEHEEVVARASRREARAQLERATHAMDEGILRSPFDGVVTRLDVEVGEHVAAGEVVVEIADDERLQLEVELPETWITAVTEGKTVEIAFPMLERRIEGRVRSVGAATRGAGLYPVVVDLAPHAELRPGLTAELLLEQPGEGGFSVPIEAVVNRSGRAAKVYAVEDGIVRGVDVVVTNISGRFAAVRGDLDASAMVVTRGHTGLYDGKYVEVRQ